MYLYAFTSRKLPSRAASRRTISLDTFCGTAGPLRLALRPCRSRFRFIGTSRHCRDFPFIATISSFESLALDIPIRLKLFFSRRIVLHLLLVTSYAINPGEGSWQCCGGSLLVFTRS